MKRVDKSTSPQALTDFNIANPDATWDELCDDNNHNTYRECRSHAVQDQFGLCAYCETKITPDNPSRCSIEHFHPKSDTSGTHNWSLDWNNIIAVCDGGRETTQEERVQYPLPEHLSCDAYKDRMIQSGKLPVACEGYMLNPLDMPAFPNVFNMNKGTGHYSPNEDVCAELQVKDNAYKTVAQLVEQTINMLNLNCDRLAGKRRKIVVNIDQNIKSLRLRNIPREKVSEKLIDRYFSQKWPEYFTAIRCCLGHAAEEHLQSIDYQG